MNALIVAHGSADERDRSAFAGADLVIAADGGALHLNQWGVRPHLVIGDMDSLDEAALAGFERGGARIERHPAAKDESDLELAIARAVASGATTVTIVGAFGGPRLDFTIANALLLADPRWRTVDLRARWGGAVARALHGGGRMALEGRIGDRVSLLPVGGTVSGIVTRGLRYALANEALEISRARGVSNEIVSRPADISCGAGSLLILEEMATIV